MKKNISKILAAVLLLLSFQIPVIAEEAPSEEAALGSENEKYSEYVELAEAVGIMEESTFEGNLYATRGELAEYINNILTYGSDEDTVREWVEEVFKEDKTDVLIPPTEASTSVFEDVSESHADYAAIKTVYRYRIMNGTGNGSFSPDERVTYLQAATALVRLLGYSTEAEESSHESVALSLGIFDGVPYNAEANVTKYELARIFCNCAEIKVMKANSSKWWSVEYGISDENMLEYYMSIYKTKGQLTGNAFTDIYGGEGLGKDRASANDTVYSIENTEYVNDLLGRDIEYWYFDDGEADYPQILLARMTGRDEAIVIPAADFEDFADNKILYESGQQIISKRVKKGAPLIYNGVCRTSWVPEDLKFETGDITIIKSRGSSEFDVIIAYAYTSCYIAEINAEDGILYGKTSEASDTLVFDTLKGTEEEYKVRIYYDTGAAVSLEEGIAQGMICDIAQSGDCIKIIIPTDNKHTVTAARITTRNGNPAIVTSDGEEYEFLKSYYDTLGSKKPILGGSYVIFENSFAKVVRIEAAEQETASKIHYLITAYDGEDDEGGYLKLLNSNGVIKKYHVLTDTKIKTEDNETVKLKSGTSLKETIGDYAGIADIDFNEEGEITAVELPQKSKTTERSGRLGIFEENEKVYWCGQGTEKHFENAMLASKAVLFRIDTTQTDEADKYKVVEQTSLKSGNTYSIKAYNYESDSIVSDCVVLSGSFASSVGDVNKTMYIVHQAYETLNDDDEIITEIEATTIATNAKISDIKLRLKPGMSAGAETFFDTEANVTLKTGDIIYCETEGDYVTRLVLVYRIFTDSGENSLYGTTGAYTPAVSKATNPYSVSGSGTIDTNVNTITKLRPSFARFFGGYAYKLESNKYLTYTSMPLSAGTKFDKSKLDSKYIAETVVLPNYYTVVNVSGDKIDVQNGDTTQIKTFVNSASSRSEVFIITRYGVAWQLVFINRR